MHFVEYLHYVRNCRDAILSSRTCSIVNMHHSYMRKWHENGQEVIQCNIVEKTLFHAISHIIVISLLIYHII